MLRRIFGYIYRTTGTRSALDHRVYVPHCHRHSPIPTRISYPDVSFTGTTSRIAYYRYDNARQKRGTTSSERREIERTAHDVFILYICIDIYIYPTHSISHLFIIRSTTYSFVIHYVPACHHHHHPPARTPPPLPPHSFHSILRMMMTMRTMITGMSPRPSPEERMIPPLVYCWNFSRRICSKR